MIKRGSIQFWDTLGHSRWGNKEDWKYSFFGKNDDSFFGKNDELTYPLPFFSKSDDFRISPKFALTTFLGSNGDPYNSETLWDIPDEETKKNENIHIFWQK